MSRDHHPDYLMKCPGRAEEGQMTALHDYRQSLVRRHLQPSTIERYTTDLRAFARWLAPTDPLDATTEDLEAFLDTRQLGPRARYRWISELHGFFEWAVVHELVGKDPTLVIDRPRPRRLLPRPFDDEDLARAIRNAGPTMKAWLVLTCYAGLRCDEIARIDRRWIVGQDLRVVGKGGHERIVPLHPEVTTALRAASTSRTGPLFRNCEGRPFSAKEVSRRIANYLDGLGIHDRAHGGRHAFGTRAYKVSKDLRAVQELLGHADPSTTAGYAAVDAEDLRAVVSALPAVG